MLIMTIISNYTIIYTCKSFTECISQCPSCIIAIVSICKCREVVGSNIEKLCLLIEVLCTSLYVYTYYYDDDVILHAGGT